MVTPPTPPPACPHCDGELHGLAVHYGHGRGDCNAVWRARLAASERARAEAVAWQETKREWIDVATRTLASLTEKLAASRNAVLEEAGYEALRAVNERHGYAEGCRVQDRIRALRTRATKEDGNGC